MREFRNGSHAWGMQRIVQHEWFHAEGINIKELKSVGSFGNNLKTGKPLDVWWKPKIDTSCIAKYYHGNHGPVCPEEEGLVHASSSVSIDNDKHAKETARKTDGAELPWHWVF